MLIDWFTVVAQAINFLILVWLLKRFLYKPVLDAIAAREAIVSGKLKHAGDRDASAKAQLDSFTDKNRQFDEAKSALMKKATDEATASAQKLTEDAKSDSDKLRQQRLSALDQEQSRLVETIRKRTMGEVFEVSRKLLADLATANLEHSMVDLFISRLGSMDAEAKGKFKTSLQSGSQPAVIRSAFAIESPQQADLRGAIKDLLGADSQLNFTTTSDIVCGIELVANGSKLSWSADDYLSAIQANASKSTDIPVAGVAS